MRHVLSIKAKGETEKEVDGASFELYNRASILLNSIIEFRTWKKKLKHGR